VLAGGTWDYLQPVVESAPASVRVGLEWLRAAHEAQRHQAVDAAVEALIRERRLLELGLATARPRDHWRRAQHVADLARAFADDGGTGLREFVAWLRERAEADWRHVEVPFPEPDDDAVRVLTVHGAKGLEFRITILAGLNVADRAQSGPVLWDLDGRPVLTGTGLRQAGFDALVEPEKQADQAEAVRLLYVAATRARDHLVVSLYRKAGGGASPASRLAELLETAPELAEPWEASSEPVPLPEPEGRDTRFDLTAWQATRDALLARASRPVAMSATGLATLNDEPDVDIEWDRAADGVHPRAGAASALGRAVHAALQTIDLHATTDIAAAVDVAARTETVDAREVDARVRSAVSSPVVRAAIAAHRCWRELPLAATVDSVLIEGYVDLCFQDDEGLTVVDYKTDAVTNADLQSRADHYAVQLGAYVLALEAVTGLPVTRTVLVFARPDGALEHEVPVATARDRARRALVEVSA
jgi:ATP-dependent helicase/nuclease subunit A